MSETTPQLPPLAPLLAAGRPVDGRTSAAKRYRSVTADLASDVGGDPSAGQWLLIQRAAGLSVQAEQIEAAMVSGDAVDIANYTKLINSLSRVLSLLGLQRRARDVTPNRPVLDAHTDALLNGDEDD